MVARLDGQSRALASGRSYVRSTIPRGIWRCLTDPAGSRLSGLMAALTMVLAVAMTTAGYLAGGSPHAAPPTPRWPATRRAPCPPGPRHHRPPPPTHPR